MASGEDGPGTPGERPPDVPGRPPVRAREVGQAARGGLEATPDAAAILIAGDLVDRGNERTNWDHFFLSGRGRVRPGSADPRGRQPRVPRPRPAAVPANFALPANGPEGVAPDLVYSVEIGDVFLAVLDSTLGVSDPSSARLQAEWLDRKLAETRRTWKFVMFHHPLYASHPCAKTTRLRDAWVPVIDRHHVDLVLQGHDHAYLRTYPMHGGRRAASPGEGTVYVVSVSGDKYCDQSPRDYTEVGFTQVSTYQTIDVKTREGRLEYRSIDVDGREHDRFTIEKPAAVPSVARR